jgi:hypothetical protein
LFRGDEASAQHLLDDEIPGNQDEIGLQRVRRLDDAVELVESVERRADVQVGKHGNLQAGELDTPVRDGERLAALHQRCRLEGECPESERERCERKHRDDEAHPLHDWSIGESAISSGRCLLQREAAPNG